MNPVYNISKRLAKWAWQSRPQRGWLPYRYKESIFVILLIVLSLVACASRVTDIEDNFSRNELMELL